MKSVAALLFAVALLVALVLSGPARASSSLAFEGGGYGVDMEIGDDGSPVIARVRFHAPGDTAGIELPADRISVEVFDPKRRKLSLRYSGGSGVAPFSLSVDGTAATLVMDSKQVSAAFDWSM